jgi:fermentation-respiration switch protein FrsA (DUF1100 family)
VEDNYINLPKKEIYIKSFDDLSLCADLLISERSSDKYIIMCHGYGGVQPLIHAVALKFYNSNLNVLVPDLRSFGRSEGIYSGMGWIDRLDVLSWIDKILTINKDASITIYGISMGAATAMAVSGEDLPANVKAIIEDSGYSSLWEEFAYQLKNIYGLPSFPLLNLSSMICKWKANYSFKEGDMAAQVAKSKLPFLFIHGTTDTFVPYSMFEKVYKAATGEKHKLIAEGAGHGQSALLYETLYWDTIKKFLSIYF